jgi:hypothetical protein
MSDISLCRKGGVRHRRLESVKGVRLRAPGIGARLSRPGRLLNRGFGEVVDADLSGLSSMLRGAPLRGASASAVDEKSQTQALERSQPILPLRPGLPERQTHDYVRHGTLSLFAAYDAATGRVLGRCYQRHRNQEFLAFLERMDAAFSDDGKSQLHLIIDNYSTQKTPKVHRWLLGHPRFHLHFTPTGSSWLNMVESFFVRITTEAIRRGSFSSVRQLQAAIDAYLAEHNKEPKPFTWTASADSIFRKLENSLS